MLQFFFSMIVMHFLFVWWRMRFLKWLGKYTRQGCHSSSLTQKTSSFQLVLLKKSQELLKVCLLENSLILHFQEGHNKLIVLTNLSLQENTITCRMHQTQLFQPQRKKLYQPWRVHDFNILDHPNLEDCIMYPTWSSMKLTSMVNHVESWLLGLFFLLNSACILSCGINSFLSFRN